MADDLAMVSLEMSPAAAKLLETGELEARLEALETAFGAGREGAAGPGALDTEHDLGFEDPAA